MSQTEPQSPCISICTLDEQNICQGCFRSAEEIADWLMAGAREKHDILQRAMQRRRDSTTIRLR